MNKPLTGKLINCLYCNKELYIPLNRFKTAKFCSLSCKGLYERIEIIKNCDVCNKEFKHISSRSNKAKYCSRSCYYKSQNTKGSIKIKCNHCEKEFNASPSDIGKRKYCSRRCVNKENKKTFKGKFTTIRKVMLNRGLINKCNRCGYDNFKKILGVHHKDRNNKNNNLENLEVLCPMCHSIEHMKHISH